MDRESHTTAGTDGNFTMSLNDPKDTDVPMHDDIRRVMLSMKALLRRKYPVDEERREQAAKIMREITNYA
jgi:hypothetical protein